MRIFQQLRKPPLREHSGKRRPQERRPAETPTFTANTWVTGRSGRIRRQLSASKPMCPDGAPPAPQPAEPCGPGQHGPGAVLLLNAQNPSSPKTQAGASASPAGTAARGGVRGDQPAGSPVLPAVQPAPPLLLSDEEVRASGHRLPGPQHAAPLPDSPRAGAGTADPARSPPAPADTRHREAGKGSVSSAATHRLPRFFFTSKERKPRGYIIFITKLLFSRRTKPNPKLSVTSLGNSE